MPRPIKNPNYVPAKQKITIFPERRLWRELGQIATDHNVDVYLLAVQVLRDFVRNEREKKASTLPNLQGGHVKMGSIVRMTQEYLDDFPRVLP